MVIVVAMFLRGQRCRGAASSSRSGCPSCRGRTRSLQPARRSVGRARAALDRLPFDFRQALINSLIGDRDGLSLVVIIGFVGQISIVQLALAGVAGFMMSQLAVDAGIGFPSRRSRASRRPSLLGLVTAVSALRVRGVSLAIVTLAGAVAIEQFGFANPTFGGGATGSPVPQPHAVRPRPRPERAVPGLDGNLPSPVFGFVVLAVAVVLVHARRAPPARRRSASGCSRCAPTSAPPRRPAIDVRDVKLVAFGIASFIAGIAGALYAYNFGSVSAERFGA